MAGHYRSVDRDQAYLLPPSMVEWLPPEHPVFFVIEVIADLAPRLTAFHRHQTLGGVGRASYDPMMLVTLLVYASWQGVRSSRQIEARCHTDVAFRIICAQDPPDHTTISRFRKSNAGAFTDLFTEVLLLCAREGMGRFGKVAIDGTKIAANASKSANRSLAHLREVAREEVEAGLAADTESDSDTDAPPPPGLRDRTRRRERLARVYAELEAEQAELDQAAADAATAAADYITKVAAGVRAGPHRRGVNAVQIAKVRYETVRAQQQAAVDAWHRENAKPLMERTRVLGAPPRPVEKSGAVRRAYEALQHAQRRATLDPADNSTPTMATTIKPKQVKRNLNDPDSRLMPTKNGWIQGFNAQAAVTEDHLIIAVDLTNNPSDTHQAMPMIHAAQAAADMIAHHTGRDDTTIGIALLDAGYDSDNNLTAPGPDRLIATGKRRAQEQAAINNPTTGPPPTNATPRQAMHHRLRTPEGIRTYRKRGAIVEPIFGHLKEIIGLRRFQTRGITTTTGELHLATTTLNLRRLWTHTAQAATA